MQLRDIAGITLNRTGAATMMSLLNMLSFKYSDLRTDPGEVQ